MGSILGLILLVLLFHRPVLHFAMDSVAPRFAQRAGLKLEWKSSGSLWSDLSLRDVQVESSENGWLELAKAEELSADYDWRALKQRNWPEAVDRVTVRGLELRADLRKLPKAKPKTASKPRASGQAPPLIWPKRLEIDGVNADVTLASGSRIQIDGLRLVQPASGAGELAWNGISITPGAAGRQPVVFPSARARLERRGQVLHVAALDLPFESKLETLEIDLAQFEAGSVKLAVDLTRAAARLQMNAALEDLFQEPFATNVGITLAGLNARDLSPLSLPQGWAFEDATGQAQLRGVLKDWRAWQAELELSTDGLEIAGVSKLDSAQLSARLEDHRLSVPMLEVKRASNQARLTAEARLTQTPATPFVQDWQATLEGELPQVAALMLKEPEYDGDVRLSAKAEGAGLRVGKAAAKLSGTDLSWQRYRLPALRLEAILDEKRLSVTVPEAALGEGNTAAINAVMLLTEALPLEADWTLRFGSLPVLFASTGLPGPPQPVGAALVSVGRMKANLPALQKGDFSLLQAEAKLEATEVRLAAQGATLEEAPALLEKVELDAQAQEGSVKVTRGLLRFDADNSITLTGEAGLATPRAFALETSIVLPKLGTLAPLLRPFTDKAPTNGELRAEASARGELSPWHCQGSVELQAAEVQVPGLPERAHLDMNAVFAGTRTELSRLEARLGPWTAQMRGVVSPASVTIEDLSLQHAETRLVSGTARLPFDLLKSTHEGGSDAGPLALRLEVKDLNPAPLAAALGVSSVPAGRLNAQWQMDGRLPALRGNLNAKFDGSEALMKDLQPPVVEVDLMLADKELKASARAVQAPLQPMTLEAALPFDAAALASDPQSLMRAPVQASLRLPETSLEFAAQFAREWIKDLPARLSLEADLAGTLAEPKLNAQVSLDCREVVLARPDWPSIRDVKLRLQAQDQTVRLEELSLLLAGGRVRAQGTANIAPLTNPEVNLELVAEEALLYRDPGTSLRADAALRCQGPLKTARLTGTAELVRGRFYKDIDLAPALKLPSDAPAVPPDTSRASARLELPAFLADWQFDLIVKTREPVLLSGNLINGAVSLSTALRGTGQEPLLSGGANVDRMRLKLPYSVLKVTSGEVLLQPERPLDPLLKVRAESFMPSHQVTVFANGPLSNVKTRLISSPPLSEADIAALLATGTTLSGDGSQAAAEAVTRGVFLYVSEWYRKTFNKEKVIDEKPSRFHFGLAPSGIGSERSVDAMQATYDFDDHWRLSGQFAPSGRVRAALGYLIRFGKARGGQKVVEEPAPVNGEAAP